MADIGTDRAVSIPGELGETFLRAARADTVFGAPVTEGGITVVPVARARWGVGGGSGRRSSQNGEPRESAGGGGGMRVDPVGFVVLRGEDAEFRPIRAEPKWGLLLGLAALGFVLGRM
jgi:uncharacterized spore protein YtfJ